MLAQMKLAHYYRVCAGVVSLLLGLIALVNSQGANSGGEVLAAMAGLGVGAVPMLALGWAYREGKSWRKIAAVVLPPLQLLVVLAVRSGSPIRGFSLGEQTVRYALALQVFHFPAAGVLAVLACRGISSQRP
jgi:hypothetical protein